MAAAAFLSITLVPVLMGYLIRGRIRPEGENPINRVLIAVYRPVLNAVLRHPRITLALAGVALLLSLLRSEEHTSELQSLMRISYAVLCLENTDTVSKNPRHQAHTSRHK